MLVRPLPLLLVLPPLYLQNPGSCPPPSPSKRAASVAGDIAISLQRASGKKHCTYEEMRQAQDFNFLIESLSGDAADIVSGMATLHRANTLRKTIAKAISQVDPKGRELAASAESLRGLRDQFMRTFLLRAQPTKFSEAHLTDLPRNTLRALMCFALNAKDGTKLPVDFTCLRWEEPLMAYLLVVYADVGNRLANYEEANSNSWGLFERDGQHIVWKLSTTDPKEKVLVSSLAEEGNWRIINNHSPEAVLEATSLDISIGIQGRFNKAEIELGTPMFENIELSTDKVPAQVKALSGYSSAAAMASSSSSEKCSSASGGKGKRPPVSGSGSAMPKGKGKGK